MKILMAAGELAPFIRIGDLADSVFELSGELRRLGHDVAVVLPYYRQIREDKGLKPRKTRIRFSVQVGSNRLPCEILEGKAANGVKVYFVSRDEYFDRSGVYGSEGRDYQDNAARFIYFTKCVLELALNLEEKPDVLHFHSWETALAPVLVRERRLPFRTVLTPHSLEFQGNFWSYDFGLTNLPGEYFSARGVEYYGSMNCLKAGILYADAVVFSNERMVEAVQTASQGCGLESVLREQRHKLYGIVSEKAPGEWNPGTDETLAGKFTAAKPAGRAKNKEALTQALGWQGDNRTIACVFAEASDGLATLPGALDRLVAAGLRVALLGEVPACVALTVASRKHEGSFVHVPDYSEKLARLALAGSDLFLMPGEAEAKATWLMRALRYGAVPVARQCGGLFSFVRDWERDTGNGFVFYSEGEDALVDACKRAVKTLRDKAEVLRGRCLRSDFSPAATARGYEALYGRLLGSQGFARAA